tara:strand:- start:520 stop:813 length:294 start_codon:yes stop_codon:yes gene_type:complete
MLDLQQQDMFNLGMLRPETAKATKAARATNATNATNATKAVNSVCGFFSDGGRLLRRCTKPTKHEFVKLCKVTALGVVFMGGMGVTVKLFFGMLLRG